MIRSLLKSIRLSFLARLLLSFCLIIGLSATFNFASVSFFAKDSHENLIQYNELNLKNTTDKYEQHYKYIHNLAINFYYNDTLNLMRDGGGTQTYSVTKQLMDELNRTIANEFLMVENILIYFAANDYVLEKDGYADANKTFTKYYINPVYGPVFWEKQSASGPQWAVYPAAHFQTIKSDRIQYDRGNLFPLIAKSSVNNDYFIAVMLDADRLFQSFHLSINDFFSVFGSNGQLLYTSNARASAISQSSLTDSSGWLLEDNHYYFYRKGEYTGNVYVNVIPNEAFLQKLSRLNAVQNGLLVASILLSLGLSVWLSLKIRNPVRQIIASIRKHTTPDSDLPARSEFEMINENIDALFKQNELIYSDLTKKNEILRKFGYMNKLRNIYGDAKLLQELDGTEKPYYLALFRLHLTPSYQQQSDEEIGRAYAYIREYLNVQMSRAYPHSVTLQMEEDQFISLVFVDETQDAYDRMIGALSAIMEAFRSEDEYAYITIALHPRLHTTSAQFTAAYDETVEMLDQRRLVGENQLITEYAGEMRHFFSLAREQEFIANMQKGQRGAVVKIVSQVFALMHAKQAGNYHYVQFANEIIGKTLRILISANCEVNELHNRFKPNEKFRSFTTLEQYVDFFTEFLQQACELIEHQQQQLKDPVIEYVESYIENHFHENISLDDLADRLNLSVSYLSNLFKEKTGVNFSQKLNEVRIHKANEMLTDSTLKIQEIAGRLGYYNTNSFIRMYKKITGMTPGEYRRSKNIEDET